MRIQDMQDLEIIDLDHETFTGENRKKDNNSPEDVDPDDSSPENTDSDDMDSDEMDPDDDDPGDDDADDDDAEEPDDADNSDEPGAGKKFPINIHIVLLVVVVVTISFILYKYLSWGQIVDPEENTTGADDYVAQSYDNILPLTDSEGNMVAPNLDDGLSIAIFGNGPFAEDRDSADGLANMLAEASGATVYNCSVSGSYLASTQPAPDMAVNPWDAFTFYWMSLFSTDLEVNDYFAEAVAALGAGGPWEGARPRKLHRCMTFYPLLTLTRWTSLWSCMMQQIILRDAQHTARKRFPTSSPLPEI